MLDLFVRLINLLYKKGILSVEEFEVFATIITKKNKDMEKIQKDLEELKNYENKQSG